MKVIVARVAVILASVAFWCAWPAYAGSLEELTAAKTAFARKDYAAAERSVNAAIDAGDLKGTDLAGALFLRGCARALGQKFDDALDDFSEALTHTSKGDDAWVGVMHFRFLTQLDLGRWSAAAADFVTLAKERPDAARNARYRILSRLLWELRTTDDNATFDVLKAMRDVSYVPDDPGFNLDHSTQTFVRMLAERGEDLVAMMELSKMRTADLLVEARIDRRYASLWAKKDFDAVTDPNEMAARELTYTADLVKRYPALALVVGRHVKALRAAGESAKAVEVAREALANPELTSVDASRIVEDKLWLRNELVYALKEQGRLDEMFAEMQPILKLDETKNGAMVNQLINFGQIMVELGRGPEGVKTAQRASNAASPYGKMYVHMIEVCANATVDKAAAEKSLGLLRKGQSENYPAMTAALLCLDRTDEAADLVKKRLSLTAHRGAVLTAVQTYKLPSFVTPMRRMLMERYAKVIARSDVQAAIKKHGRIESFPFIASYWGNI